MQDLTPNLLAMAVPDDSGHAWFMLIVYLLLAIGFSFLCSLLEAALLSVPRPHVKLMEEKGHRAGLILQRFKENIDQPLAAILTVNTIAHTAGAAGVGAEVMVIFGEAWVAVASAVVTLLILVLSEIIPKSLGAKYARRLSPFTAYAVQSLIYITWPLVWMLGHISGGLMKKSQYSLSRDEVRAVADMAELSGTLTAEESTIVRNVLAIREVVVERVMTPRPVVFMLQQDATVREVTAAHNPLNFSRMPVYHESADDVVGLVTRQDILYAEQHDEHGKTMSQLMKPIGTIPELATVAKAMEQMLKSGDHLLHVVDEYGGTAGIVTLEDTIETLLGVEITDETDPTIDMRDLVKPPGEQSPEVAH